MRRPLAIPTLAGVQLRAWEVELHLESREMYDGWRWMTEMERQRAQRLRTPELKRRYVASHTSARQILAEELGANPEDLRFSWNDQGKPRLDLPEGAPPLFFNLSHSEDRMVLACSPTHEVGIDLERAGNPAPEMIGQCLTVRERIPFAQLPTDEQSDLFIRYWTGKEAVLKAEGSGLFLEPNQVELDFPPAEGEGRAELRTSGRPPQEFPLHYFSLGSEFRGALAIGQEVKHA